MSPSIKGDPLKIDKSKPSKKKDIPIKMNKADMSSPKENSKQLKRNIKKKNIDADSGCGD